MSTSAIAVLHTQRDAKGAKYNSSMGEPRRLTAEVQERIVQHVAEGNYPEVAAQLAGVPRRSFQRWLHDGRQDLDAGVEDSSVARLALAVEKARAECVAKKVKRIQEAGEKSWQAGAWWLERNLPNYYGRNQRIEVESKSVVVHATLHQLAEQKLLSIIKDQLESGETLFLESPDTDSQ